jgi:hypothetical protein
MDRLLTMSLVCWSLPAALCVLMAQDTTFLLIWIALSLASWRKGRPFLAGLIFSMCLAKFHFLTFIPLLLLLQRRWRFGLGFATGSVLLLGVSFAVQGIHWPADYLHMLLHGNAQPARDVMYNIRGALPDSPQAFYIYLAGCAVVAVLVAAICLRREFDLALCLCLLGALMVSPHVYAQDYVLAVPLCALLLAGRAHLHPGSLPAAVMLSCPFVLHSIPGTILIGLFVLAVSAVEGLRAQPVSYSAAANTPKIDNCPTNAIDGAQIASVASARMPATIIALVAPRCSLSISMGNKKPRSYT